MSVKHVYIGLPNELKDRILWVGRKYRTNRLSHVKGGADVIVEYGNGVVLGYDWVKRPSGYVYTAFADQVGLPIWDLRKMSKNDQLGLARDKIDRLYARRYSGPDDFSTAAFVEVWDSRTSNSLPWEVLEVFDSPNRFGAPAPRKPPKRMTEANYAAEAEESIRQEFYIDEDGHWYPRDSYLGNWYDDYI